MTVQLNSQAAALLKQVHKQTGAPISADVEQAIQKAAGAQQTAPMTLKELETVLLAAMPEQKSDIQQACKRCAGYHPDQTNAQFLTQILDTRVEKDNQVVQRQVNRRWQSTNAGVRDPYYTDMQMDPRADVVMLFNARDVDRTGRPLLMKIVARERADLSKIDLSQYRTQDGQATINDFDVMKVADDADYIEAVDQQETEFTFGDPLKQVSLGKKGEELSASVMVAPKNVQITTTFRNRIAPNSQIGQTRTTPQQSDSLDRQPVVRFDDRIQLGVSMKDTFPESAWLDDDVAQHVDVSMEVGRGWMFEPGAQGQVSFLGTTLKTAIQPDDAQQLGNDAERGDITVAGNRSLRWMLTQNVDVRAHAGPTGVHDQQQQNIPAVNLVFANAAKIKVADAALQPLQDAPLTKAQFAAANVEVSKVPLQDPQSDGQRVTLKLNKAFLEVPAELSLKGWKVVAGFTDHDGKWQQCKPETVRNKTVSQDMEFTFDLTDADQVHQQNRSIEIRLFNDNGVPAQRVTIPFREIGWQV